MLTEKAMLSTPWPLQRMSGAQVGEREDGQDIRANAILLLSVFVVSKR